MKRKLEIKDYSNILRGQRRNNR
ncbi:hypothetical protein NW739_06325 [Mycoplasmopsis felis]|nr:hypothetical protein [Mycoplasmopsis felis]MCU9940262.1 hypothetical protein [Mycoplasmopsis felis]